MMIGPLTIKKKKRKEIMTNLDRETNPNVDLFLATHWTLEWCLFNSKALSDFFIKSCSVIHKGTDEFKKQSNGTWDKDLFRNKLAEKLKNRSLNKVAIAAEMCQMIKESLIPINFEDDDYAYYLIKAINFVCR